MQFFPLLYRLGAEDRFLIWISHEKERLAVDGVVVDAEGYIPSFSSLTCLRAYADRKDYALEKEEPILLNLDRIDSWTKAPDAQVDCEGTLNAWNLFSDVAHSVPMPGAPFKQLDVQFPNIYKKVFWGNNLPALTPRGKSHVPTWSPEDVASLSEVLAVGLDLFKRCIRLYPE